MTDNIFSEQTSFEEGMSANNRVREILNMIGKFSGKKIITYELNLSSRRYPNVSQVMRGDFDMMDSEITSCHKYEIVKRWRNLFLGNTNDNMLGIVVRQFTSEIVNNLPIKNIRMFTITK